MRIIILIPFFLLVMVAGNSQQLHFAYLQTDTHTPFYITLNKKNYSSTAAGYIILPKLQNGDYPLRIGFAKNEGVEQEYVLQVKDNDQGFLIKDFGDKGWGLFNLQTMAVQYAGTAAQEKAKLAAAEKAEAEQRQRKMDEELQAAALQRRDDSLKTAAIAQQTYTDSIATIVAANRQRMYEDSIVNRNNLTKQQQLIDSITNAKAIAKENERLEKIADSVARVQAAAIEKQTEKATEIIKAEKSDELTTPPVNPLPQKKEPIKIIPAPALIQQQFTDSGWHYAYHITNNNQRETVYVFIPASQPKPPVTTTVIEEKETVPVNTANPDSVKFLNSSTGQDIIDTLKNNTELISPATDKPIIAGSATPAEVRDSIPVVAEKAVINPNCREVAGDKDFLTARKKIAAAFGTDAMLVAAQKVLKQRCYTTEQLRNLCILFLTDVGRYQFLDMAYPVASDTYRYATLQDLLIDAYFVQRFKAMLR